MITKQKGKQKKTVRLSVSLDHLGFTLLEILVALVMGSIFITAICTLIIDQTQTHEDHQMKVMMQQEGRAALSILSNELMIAGYSPKPDQVAGMINAAIDNFEFNYFNVNTDTNISYSWHLQNDGAKVVRRNGNNNAFLKNVEVFRVLYAYDKDGLGAGNNKYGVLEKDGNNVIWAYDDDNDDLLDNYYTLNSVGKIATNDESPKPLTAEPSIDRIRAAKIWLLMRSNKRKNKDAVENKVDNIPGVNIDTDLDTDNYSYRLYTTTVKLRNMYY
ncbi:PilW family protein [Desulfoluna sp.]|uniref:PilW family protein n=1 Tax=Desulfoluna sp. TaxID=2045199 RepID=UPI0026304006|nr:PilW family protein [Desulfoluna sp.]